MALMLGGLVLPRRLTHGVATFASSTFRPVLH